MSSALTEMNYAGDIVLWEPPLYYSRVSGTIVASQTITVGMPLMASGTSYTPVTAGNEASTTGVALAAVVTEAGETADIPVLVRNSLINSTQLDCATQTLTRATVVTALLALGIVARTEADYQSLAEDAL